jgi:hypothetical protein
MKRILVLAAAFVTLPTAIPAAHAQTWELGGGLVYGSEIEQLGAQVNAYFRLTDQIRVGGDVTFYARDSETIFGTRFETSLTELNANGHYLFFDEPGFGAYGIGGVNLSFVRARADIPGIGRLSESDSEVGLNVGVGAESRMGWGTIYGEVKYVISDFDQAVIGVGVRFPMGR